MIIAKNIGRVLLFQRPEWSEDLQEWKREIHIKCTYDGVQLSETEFPRNWLIEGIQIDHLMAIENESNQMVLFLNLSDLLLRNQGRKD